MTRNSFDQPVRRHPIVEVGLEGLVVFDTARQLDAADAMTSQHLLRLIDRNQIDQQVGGKVAARHDHVPRQIADAHRLADGGMDVLVGIAAGSDAERRAVHEAQKTISDVEA